MTERTPELSVVLATDTFETITETIGHLRSQTAAGRVEVVIATPSETELGLDASACRGLGSVRVVETRGLDPVRQLDAMRAAAVHAASAPVVVFGESHSFPDPHSFETLIDAHRGPWVAVAQAIRNGNPHTMTSWTNLYLDYGQWADPAAGGPIDVVPTHNGSFKRAQLVDCGERLPALLRYSDGINAVLRTRGGSFYLEPRARTSHVNVSRWTSWLRERVAAGRAYAGARAEDWPTWRRLLYAGGSPLIPAVRFRRVLRQIGRTGRSGELLPAILPTLALATVISGFGELLGYAFGAGRAPHAVGEMELHRMQHIRPGDLASDGEEA